MLKTGLLLIVSLILLGNSQANAAFVASVKGQRVLIDLDGDLTSVNDEFFLINPETNKRTAIIRIQQVKPRKALGEIIKGRAAVGYTLKAKAPSKISMDAPSAEDFPRRASSRDDTTGVLKLLKDSYGVVGGLLMNSMDADVSYKDGFGITQKSSASMSGTGFAAGGYYDYVLSPQLVGHAYAGIEQFNVSGSAAEEACAGSKSCDAKINYLSMYGLAKWYPILGKNRVWAGGGFGYLLALSKSSSALNQSQISSNQVFTLGAGVDLQQDRRNYIPISFEYNLFPSSSTVKAHQIIIRAGWAWNL